MPLDTVAGLFSRVQYNLGRGAQSTIVLLIPEWVNLIQREICRTGKWWFNFTESSSATLTAGNDTMTLPSDFLDEEYVFLKDSNGNIDEVLPMDDKEYRQAYTDQTGASYQSLPLHYVLRNNDILFRPIADATYTILLGYWAQLADLVSGGATNDLLLEYPDVLETGATFKGFEYMQQYDDAQYWIGRYNEEFKKMRVANTERILPGEFILSVRRGRRSHRLSRKVRRNFF